MRLYKRLARLSAGVAMGLGLVGAGTAAAQDVVKLGYTGPLSGPAALFGRNSVTGLEMAVNELNEKGGVEIAGKKYKIELVVLDDKYSPAEAGINGKRLVQEHQTPVVFAGHTGGTFALQAFNEQSNFLVMSYTSVPHVLERGNKLTVRMPPSFLGYVEPFVKSAMANYGKKVGLIPGNHDYAKIWTKAFAPAWTAAGGEVVIDNPMDYNKDTDFYSSVTKVLAAKPDVLFVGGASEPTALVVKQARELGFKGGFVIMDQAKMDEMAKVTDGLKALEGAHGVMPLIGDEAPSAKRFVEKFRELYKKDPTHESSLHYAGLHMAVEAMKQAGTVTDGAAIRANFGKALKTLPAEYNPHAVTDIDDKGGLVGPTPAAMIKNAKYVSLQ